MSCCGHENKKHSSDKELNLLKKNDKIIKALLLGPSGAGKTTLLRTIQGFQNPLIAATVGCETAFINFPVEEQTFTLEITDPSGSEAFAQLIPSMVRGVELVIAVLDASNLRASIKALKNQLENIFLTQQPKRYLVVINKMDLNASFVLSELTLSLNFTELLQNLELNRDMFDFLAGISLRPSSKPPENFGQIYAMVVTIIVRNAVHLIKK